MWLKVNWSASRCLQIVALLLVFVRLTTCLQLARSSGRSFIHSFSYFIHWSALPSILFLRETVYIRLHTNMCVCVYVAQCRRWRRAFKRASDRIRRRRCETICNDRAHGTFVYSPLARLLLLFILQQQQLLLQFFALLSPDFFTNLLFCYYFFFFCTILGSGHCFFMSACWRSLSTRALQRLSAAQHYYSTPTTSIANFCALYKLTTAGACLSGKKCWVLQAQPADNCGLKAVAAIIKRKIALAGFQPVATSKNQIKKSA